MKHANIKLFSFILTFMAVQVANAGGFVCIDDRRPVDGPLTKLELIDTNNKHSLKLTKTFLGRGQPNDPIFFVELLALDVPCVHSPTDARISSCFRSREGVEKHNTIIEVKRVDETAVVKRMSGIKDWKRSFLDISVGSPLFKELKKNYRFLLSKCAAK